MAELTIESELVSISAFDSDEESARAGLAAIEQIYGIDRIETASHLNHLAFVLKSVGKGAEAAKLRERVLRIVQTRYSGRN